MEHYNYTVHSPEVPKKRRWGLLVAALCLMFTLAGGAVGGFVVWSQLAAPDGAQLAAPAPPQGGAPGLDLAGGTDAARGQENLSEAPPTLVASAGSGRELTPKEIYAQRNPSVVAISTEQTGYNVFGRPVSQASAGSGFLVTEDGYVVTNHHVIEGASSITVVLYDQTEYEAKLVGSDSKTDLAVLKIEGSGFQPAALGDSETLSVGDPVVAIGNPLGELANSLSAGWVSALNREFNADGNPRSMIQTDAAVNPGNSGGPLFNDRAEVVGIVNAKYASASIEGLGFAIPISEAEPVIEELMRTGYVTGRPQLGVRGESVDPFDVQRYGVPEGAYIYSVDPGSAAEKAGIQQGDIITKFGGKTITSFADLSAAKAEHKAGDTVEAEIYRYDARFPETLTVSVTLDEEKPEETQPQPDNAFPWSVPGGDFGAAS